jgi:predicted outer membrane repeat protein
VTGAATVSVTNCANSGVGSLRSAVTRASPGDTIDFALSPSCRLITETSGSIIIATNLAIEGPGAGTLAVSGDEANTVFVVDSGVTASIFGLTIRDGTAYAGGAISNGGTLTITDTTLSGNGRKASLGGGIYNFLGTLTVRHSKLLDNSAATGGGIFSTGGTLSVTDSTFSGNRAPGSGGGGISSGGTLTVTDSTFSHNSAPNGGGGGIAVATGTVKVTDTAFSGNSALDGGGIFTSTNNPGTVTVTDSTLSDNTANGGTNTGGGGGILNDGNLTVTDATFSHNSAADGGGGISNASTLSVTASTLSDNSAGPGGGGIYNFGIRLTITHATLSHNTAPAGEGSGIYTRSGATTLVATIVANSDAGLGCHVSAGTLTDGGYNLDDDGSCGFSSTNHSLSDTPAGLAPALVNNGGPTQTISLESGSAAVDSVTSASDCTGKDQRGVAWPTSCDIGAIQSGSLAVVNAKVSTIASSLLSPFQAFKPLKTVVVDAGIAAGAVLLIAFPSQIFNYTFLANYDEIRQSWQRLFRRKGKRGHPATTTRDFTTNRFVFGVVVLIGALLSSLNDPHFGIHMSSLVTYLAVVGSITVGAAVPGLVTRAYHRGRFGAAEASLHALPAGLAVAAGCVLVSRLTGFQPGYLYGVVVGLQFNRELKPHEKGHIVALTTLTTLVVAVAAWFAWVPINHVAERPGAFVGLVLLDDLLAAVFVSGLVGSVFGLIPLQFLPGHTLKQWRRGAWAAVFAIALFGLIQVMIRPHGAHPHHVPMVVTIGLFVTFGLGSLAFRDYFERKHRRVEGEPVLPWLKRLHELISVPPVAAPGDPEELADSPRIVESDRST